MKLKVETLFILVTTNLANQGPKWIQKRWKIGDVNSVQGIIDRSDDSEHGRQTFLQLEPATPLSPASVEKVLQHQLIFCESKWWGILMRTTIF